MKMDKRKINGPKFLMSFEQYQIDRLDEIAKRFKISRAEATRRIVDTGLDAYTVFEGIGVVKLAEVIRRTKEACEKSVGASLF